MNEPTPPIGNHAARLTTTRVDDADETTLVCVLHLSARPVYAECHAVSRAGASRFIGRSPDAGWRIDSASAEYFADGTVRLWMSAWPDTLSGTAARVTWVDFPGVLHVAGLDKHTKDVIYERVKTPTTGTHQEVRKIAYDEAVRVVQG